MNEIFNPEEIDETKPMMVGHLLIRDGETKQILVNQRDTMAQQHDLAETEDAEGTKLG
jgi:hypothetical protein